MRKDTLATVDSSRDVIRRLGGCLVAFVGSMALLTVGDYLGPSVPSFALQLAAILLGALLIHLYGTVARRRWHVYAPDAIGILKRDMTAIYDREATDLRLAFKPGASLADRALHELLYSLKWVGHMLVFMGLGSVLVSVMQALGITKWVAMAAP